MPSLPVWTLPLLLGVTSCGGATKPPEEAPPPADVSPTSAEVAPEEPEAPAGPDCSDGTCFVCGSGVCPKGAYCDAGAPSGGACAWVAECPGEPSCACLKKTLGAGCSCEAAEGGPLVRCN